MSPVAAVALATVSFGAHATLYTYTGNYDNDSWDYDGGWVPRRLTAWFDMDVADPSSPQAGAYHVNSWEISAGTQDHVNEVFGAFLAGKPFPSWLRWSVLSAGYTRAG